MMRVDCPRCGGTGKYSNMMIGDKILTGDCIYCNGEGKVWKEEHKKKHTNPRF